ncbi:MAG TPA: DUF3179 domain-containing protein [Novimethylophilus sp.]|jgi:hypothetical protein|uniref:DUF3179 domain-containing protein n=1 Tax=Novimethylophilus sp. TaxID=2137426 RepID=UPI002F3EFBFC
MQRLLRIPILLVIMIGLTAAVLVKNDFDLTGSLVPADEILSGGPPRDGIPAIDRPKFVRAGEADHVKPQDRVLGIERGNIAKAYPISIMNWHEIVNDRFGNDAIAVTYCPLCGTGMAFDASVGNKPLNFGVSGLLYNSDVLLYDRQSQSLWSQIMRTAVSGPFKGTKLNSVPIMHTTWADWKKRHPDTLVLSTDTGYRRDYQRNPYAGYEANEGIIFPVKFRAQGYHPKEQVIGLEIDGKFKAYPFAELAKTSGEIADEVNGRHVTVRFDAEHRAGTVFDDKGRELPTVIAFWFAWYGFHPEAEIFHAK